ncbi:hypothetical protein STENO_004094 [Stenotrophomonas maltophilia]
MAFSLCRSPSTVSVLKRPVPSDNASPLPSTCSPPTVASPVSVHWLPLSIATVCTRSDEPCHSEPSARRTCTSDCGTSPASSSSGVMTMSPTSCERPSSTRSKRPATAASNANPMPLPPDTNAPLDNVRPGSRLLRSHTPPCRALTSEPPSMRIRPLSLITAAHAPSPSVRTWVLARVISPVPPDNTPCELMPVVRTTLSVKCTVPPKRAIAPMAPGPSVRISVVPALTCGFRPAAPSAYRPCPFWPSVRNRLELTRAVPSMTLMACWYAPSAVISEPSTSSSPLLSIRMPTPLRVVMEEPATLATPSRWLMLMPTAVPSRRLLRRVNSAPAVIWMPWWPDSSTPSRSSLPPPPVAKLTMLALSPRA